MSVEDVGTIVAAFERLEGLPGVRRDRVGILGAARSGELALLAAGDPAIADRVRFCFASVPAMTSGSTRPPGISSRLASSRLSAAVARGRGWPLPRS